MGCKHAEDGCTASDVQYDLVLEDVSVLVDGVAVGSSPHLVFLHRRSRVSM